jgi:glycosyltransferase involved in cell wall biosynthesis
MNSFPKLTIGIPTYNRARILPETIDSIVTQIDNNIRDKLEILISDNASTDHTEQVIQAIIKQYPNLITYRRNKINIGFSANVDSVVRHAKNPFVLIMSDDDSLYPQTLLSLLANLQNHLDVGAVFLSYQNWDKQLKNPCSEFKPSPNIYDETGTNYISRHKCFTPALISGIVINRNLWIENNPEYYFDINSIHLIMLPLIIAKSSCLTLTDRPYVKYRNDMGHWSIETDPTYPFPLIASYLKGCRAIKQVYPSKLHKLLYCSTMRTATGHAIRNKVLWLPFPRKQIVALLQPLFEKIDFITWIYTFAFSVVSWLPRWVLYPFFRPFVPEKL